MMMKVMVRSIVAGLSSLIVMFGATLVSYGGDLKAGTIIPYDLTVESLTNPTGIDSPEPRFSWKSKALRQGAYHLKQSAWQIVAASSKENLDNGTYDLWDTGKVNSSDSLNITYQGKQLKSSQYCFWKVRVWDQDGNISPWSESGRWIMGILDAADWSATWIGMPESMRPEVDLSQAYWIGCSKPEVKTTYLRKIFKLDISREDIEKKNIYAIFRYAGNEKFEMFLNGEPVGFSIGVICNPNLLRSIDLSDRLVPGTNILAISLKNRKSPDPIAFLGKLEIGTIDKTGIPAKMRDVSRRGVPKTPFQIIKTDSSWTAAETAGKNWNTIQMVGGWPNATVLFEPDGGPWGKVRRTDEKEAPLFQKKFTLTKKVKQAVLHICGLGFYEASLSGKRIGDKLLDPAPTNFDKTVLYSTYDLTEELNKGVGREQDLRVLLGHGWYDVRAIVTWNFDAAPWKDFPRLIAQLELVYDDGSKEKIVSDANWSVLRSPFLFDCIRQGEVFDANRKPDLLGQAVKVPAPKGKMKAQMMPPAKVTEAFKPATVHKLDDNLQVVDLGRNIAGWCAVTIRNSRKGDVVRFRYSERIDQKGQIERQTIEKFFMEGSSSLLAGEIGRFQTDYYICEGKPVEVFEPRFTYHGFQYLEISGLRDTIKTEDIVAKIVHTAFKKVGSFLCDNELLNKIQGAVLLSYRGNFVDGYPTDCPHREKCGWTGDAHIATEQAMYNWDNTGAYEKWMGDIRDEQRPDGNLPGIIPTSGWGYQWGNGPAWDSALILIPWYLYVYRKDERVLAENYEAMKLYLSYMDSKATDHLVSHGLGDWYPAKTDTPVEVISSGYYYLDTMIVARIAQILGKNEESIHYFKKATLIKNAYIAKHLKPNGICANGSQTAQATFLHQGFASELSSDTRQKIFDQLQAAVLRMNKCPDFGIMGTKYIFRTLSEFGRTDLGIAILLQEKQPSFANWIRRGGGTLWSDWQDGSSRNHIMFGDISSWFYQGLGGIKLGAGFDLAIAHSNDLDSVAFKKILIEPRCSADFLKNQVKKITFVDTNLDSPYGPIRSAWRWDPDYTALTVDVTIPVNTQAIVSLPALDKKMKPVKGIPKVLKSTDNRVRYSLGSGVWQFSSK